MADQVVRWEQRKDNSRTGGLGQVQSRSSGTTDASSPRPTQVTSLSSGLEPNSLPWWCGPRARQQLEKERCPGEQNRLEVLHCGSQPWLNVRITWGTVKTSDFPGSHPRLTKTYSKHILATKESLLATQEAFINFLEAHLPSISWNLLTEAAEAWPMRAGFCPHPHPS